MPGSRSSLTPRPVMRLLPTWFEDYNTVHPHSGCACSAASSCAWCLDPPSRLSGQTGALHQDRHPAGAPASPRGASPSLACRLCHRRPSLPQLDQPRPQDKQVKKTLEGLASRRSMRRIIPRQRKASELTARFSKSWRAAGASEPRERPLHDPALGHGHEALGVAPGTIRAASNPSATASRSSSPR